MNEYDRKEIIESALIHSFVDDYNAYNKTIKNINKDFKKLNLNYQYTYDDFCKEFLKETIKNSENIDIFESQTDYETFFENFWKFNLYNMQIMLNNKLNELGSNYEDFQKLPKN